MWKKICIYVLVFEFLGSQNAIQMSRQGVSMHMCVLKTIDSVSVHKNPQPSLVWLQS